MNHPVNRVMNNSRVQYQTKANAKAANRGRVLQPSFDPPSVISQPWNSVTLVIEGTTSGQITIANLWSILVAQLRLDATQVGELRVMKIRIWGDQGNSASDIVLRPYSIIAGDQYVLSTIADEPTNTRRAHVGYQWPVVDQECVLLSSATRLTATVSSTGSAVPYLGYVDVLWRTSSTSTRASFNGTLSPKYAA